MGEMEYDTVSRYVLDQDTGSAIKDRVVWNFHGNWQVAGDRWGDRRQGTTILLLLKQ